MNETYGYEEFPCIACGYRHPLSIEAARGYSHLLARVCPDPAVAAFAAGASNGLAER